MARTNPVVRHAPDGNLPDRSRSVADNVPYRVTRYPGRSRHSCAADLERAVTLLNGRWKMMILAHVYGEEVMRYSDLHRAVPKISQKVLSQQLQALERDDLLTRTVYPEVPPRVEYRLTDAGLALEPVFFALLDWVGAFRR